MTFNILSFTQPISASEGFEVAEVRAIVAKHLGIDIGRVTDEAYFGDDLGADWLDRLELLMQIEDRLVDVEIMDGDADQIELVGDLIRYIEDAWAGSMAGRRRAFAA
jgi:acyl carrier protein